jgi:hypothetical protein
MAMLTTFTDFEFTARYREPTGAKPVVFVESDRVQWVLSVDEATQLAAVLHDALVAASAS